MAEDASAAGPTRSLESLEVRRLLRTRVAGSPRMAAQRSRGPVSQTTGACVPPDCVQQKDSLVLHATPRHATPAYRSLLLCPPVFLNCLALCTGSPVGGLRAAGVGAEPDHVRAAVQGRGARGRVGAARDQAEDLGQGHSVRDAGGLIWAHWDRLGSLGSGLTGRWEIQGFRGSGLGSAASIDNM
jgi:hypothetical protein